MNKGISNLVIVFLVGGVVLAVLVGLMWYGLGGLKYFKIGRQSLVDQSMVTPPDPTEVPLQPMAVSADGVSVYISDELLDKVPAEGPVLTAQKVDLILNETKVGFIGREYDQSRFIIVVQAELPNLANGSSYTAWLINPADNQTIKLGKLVSVNDSYLIEGQGHKYLGDYTKVVITEEMVDDEQMEAVVVEGSFGP